jgi:hypothetical protein
MKGYEAVAADEIMTIQITPLEPCSISDFTVLGHTGFLKSQGLLFNTKSVPIDKDPSSPLILRGQNYRVQDMDPLHLYVSDADCSEESIRQFHNAIIRKGKKFREAIDKLIRDRRLISALSDIFGGETALKAIQMQKIFSPEKLDRTNKFVIKNRLEIETTISETHFQLEALRYTLIRMLDEIWARRVGWGYAIKHPGHIFMVYMQHAQFIKQIMLTELIEPNLLPTPRPTPAQRREKRSHSNYENCITEVKSIDQLTKLMDRQSNKAFQIFHFNEKEQNLKNAINNVVDIFDIWLTTNHGWFVLHYDSKYKFICQMCVDFRKEILDNPYYNTIELKMNIIKDFKQLIMKEMNYNLLWYYYPLDSLNKIQKFINKYYKNKYPIKPPLSKVPFHAEL